MDNIKCVVCGDGDVGKTCMLLAYTNNNIHFEYFPATFNDYGIRVTVDKKTVNLSLQHTAGQENYDRLRPLTYNQTNVFLICFSIDSQSSFENVRTKWYPEIQHYAEGVPFILVGTKADKRSGDTPADGFVTSAQAEALKNELNAYKYLECSAKTQEGIQQVFDEAVRCVFVNRKLNSKKKTTCVIL